MTEYPYKLVVLIVCYRSVDLTIDALRSLVPEVEAVPGTHVIVCENGSGPEAVTEIQNAVNTNNWQAWVTLKAIHPNRGFAGGNNAVLRELLAWKSPPEFILLLNSDTIVRPGALVALLQAAEDHPEAGVLSPRLEWPDGTAQISTFNYQNPLSEMLAAARTGILTKLFAKQQVPIPVRDESFEPPWVSFACGLIRRQTFQQVGVLDDGYYLYFDDVDYCRRAWGAGWHVRYCPQAQVVHLRGKSNPVKTLAAERKRRPQYYYCARARYFAKFYGRAGLWFTNLLWHAGRSVAFFRELIRNKTPHLCDHEARDIWTNAWTPLQDDQVVKQQDLPDPAAAVTKKEQHAAA